MQIDVSVREGVVRGQRAGGVVTFLGVPYAAPPMGPLRLRPPQPVLPWEGVRPALEAGPSAPQRALESFAGLDAFAVTGARWRRGDDYLTLNVWAPVNAAARPVVVYVHGGGLVLGTKDAAVYDGTAFARDGVVAVAMNYRLGVEGFVAIPGAPTNLGLRDVIASLRWLQDNVAAFGGDPGNVTVVGESGGAMLVACLVSSPLARGLFRRAVVQSGHGSAVYPITIAERTATALARVLSVTPDAEGFRSVPPERAVQALQKVSRPGTLDLRDANGFDPSFGLGVVNPVHGDDVLPIHPLLALEQGAGADVELLIGTTATEASYWFGPTRLSWLPTGISRRLLRRIAPRADALFDAYAEQATERAERRGGAVLARILTDMAFRWPARQFAAAHQGRTHVYEFDWASPAAGGRMGAAHGLELPFVFDTLASTTGRRGMTGMSAPQELADYVHGTWVRFITDGHLPWSTFDSQTRAVHQLAARTTIREPVMPAAAYTPVVAQRAA